MEGRRFVVLALLLFFATEDVFGSVGQAQQMAIQADATVQDRHPFGFTLPPKTLDGGGQLLSGHLYAATPDVMSRTMQAAINNEGVQESLDKKVVRAYGEWKQAWADATEEAKQGVSQDLHQINETYTEMYVNTICPTKKAVLAKLMAVEQIFEKITPFSQLAAKISEYPVLAVRLLRHRLFPTEALHDVLDSPHADAAFATLYQDKEYQHLLDTDNLQRPLQNFTYHIGPNNQLVSDPAHLATLPPFNPNLTPAQQLLSSQLHSTLQPVSLLETETQTQTGGIMKILVCGVIGTLLVTWMFICIIYWGVVECMKVAGAEKDEGCFGLQTAYNKYLPALDVVTNVVYHLDTKWPPRKNWIESMLETLPTTIQIIKKMQEAWSDSDDPQGSQEMETPGGDIQLTEEDIETAIELVPDAINRALEADDMDIIPFTDEEKQAKAEEGYRKEEEIHEAVRNGLSSSQSCSGPSYSPYGLFRFVLQTMVFLFVCDALIP